MSTVLYRKMFSISIFQNSFLGYHVSWHLLFRPDRFSLFDIYWILAEVPALPEEIFKFKFCRKEKNLNFLPLSQPGYPWVSTKNVSPFGPVVWPATGNIYPNVLFYYKEDKQAVRQAKYKCMDKRRSHSEF